MGRYPQLQGKADDQVVKAIRELFEYVYSLKGKIEPPKPALTVVPSVLDPSNPTQQQGLNLALSAPLQVSSGHGDPNGVVIGNLGDIYLNLDGGKNTTMYVKGTGKNADNTGWYGVLN